MNNYHSYRMTLVILIFLLAGCNLPLGNSSPTLPPIADATDTSIPVTATSTPFRKPVLKVTGSEQVVFDWTHDRCHPGNLADLPSRAFRGADGQVQLILSHTTSYRMVGPDLNNLTVDCSAIFSSDYDADSSRFNDSEWLAAPYTEDGQTVYAIIHNEYHGWEHRGQCSVFSTQTAHFPCWYNTLTLAVSTDGGATYKSTANPPAHFIAGLPFPYEPDAGPAGPRNPSNIIKGRDGYYYQFANVAYYADNKQWVCLMRTNDLSDPSAWRFWDGQGFDGRFIDPYLTTPGTPEDHLCPALEWDNIGASLNDSITYNTYLDRYVLVGLSADQIDHREVWGIYYSFSDDLIHWTRRKLLAEMPLPWTVENGGSDLSILYPSLLDPNSDSRNFETTGKTAYLYYTRHNFGQGNPDRDLIRVPVEFFPSEVEAQKTTIDTSTPSAPGAEPVTISIVKNGSFDVLAGAPVELTLTWETKTSQQVADFLSASRIEVQLDGTPLPNTMDAWGEIQAGADLYNSQWIFPVGVLDSGHHTIKVKITLTSPVSDGLGNEYNGVILNNTLDITVGE